MKKIYMILVALLILSSSFAIADDDDRYEDHDGGDDERHSSGHDDDDDDRYEHDDDDDDRYEDDDSWDASDDFIIKEEPVEVIEYVVIEEPVVEVLEPTVEPVFVSNYTEPVYNNMTNVSVFNENLSKLDDLYNNVDLYLANNTLGANVNDYDDYLKQKNIDLENETSIVDNANEKRENVFVYFFARLFRYLGLMG